MRKLTEDTRNDLISQIKLALPTARDKDLISTFGLLYYPLNLDDKDYEETGKPELVRGGN